MTTAEIIGKVFLPISLAIWMFISGGNLMWQLGKRTEIK